MPTLKKYYDEALTQINSTSVCLKKGLQIFSAHHDLLAISYWLFSLVTGKGSILRGEVILHTNRFLRNLAAESRNNQGSLPIRASLGS